MHEAERSSRYSPMSRSRQPVAVTAFALASLVSPRLIAAAQGAPPASQPQISSPAESQPQSPPTSASQPDSLTAQQQRQLQVFGPVLLNPSNDIDAETRRNAAAELLDMGTPGAFDLLSEAVRSRKPAVANAALAAMQRAVALPDALLDPCIAVVETVPSDVLPALAVVLARYGDAAAARVADVALRTGATATARHNATTALGSCRSREAAAALMRILETTPVAANPLLDPTGTSLELARTAIASLERMTGLTYGQDLAAWRRWWTGAADDSDEQWYRLVSESLANRVATLQQQVQEQRLATDRTSRELFSTYRDLFPALPIAEQLERLERLLEDRLPPLRDFGLNRVGVLARDSVRIPPNVVNLVRIRLNDDVPELRLAAADLLDELGDERAAEAIATRLNAEASPQVIAGLLNVLSRRPTQAALAPALRLLASETSAGVAADALWQMLQAPPLNTPENIAQVRDPARLAARSLTPATLRLAALAGDDHDIGDLTALLDHDDPARRAAVAEGFWKRGLRQPLIDRAVDEAVYPFAIRAIADGPADLPAFSLLAGMRPPESHRRLWSEVVLRFAARLPPNDLLAIDDVLRNIAYADVALRRDLLLQAAAQPRDALAATSRLKIVERLAPMLIDLGEAGRAYELIVSINGAAATAPALAVPRFQAAALTGHFDLAAQVQPDAEVWISLLTREFERGNPACPRLHDEIVRRFSSQLSPASMARLNEIGQALEAGEHPQG